MYQTFVRTIENISSSLQKLSPFKRVLLLVSLFILLSVPLHAQDTSPDVELSGYIKELAGLSFDNQLGTFHYDNILQNRIESSWTFSDQLEGQIDLRNRLLSGYRVRNFPGYEQLLDHDPGFVDMSWTPVGGRNHIWHLHIDRLNLSYYNGPYDIQVGRQRLNWSRTFVWSPNDLFNNFAYLDFDYEERPGTDAVSFSYSWSYASELQLAYQPADRFEESVIAGMLRESLGSYDVQFIGGYYRDLIALGGGLSGYLSGAGLKGELTYFHPTDGFSDQFGTVSAAVSVDYMFPSSVYLRGELLYNGGWEKPQASRPLTDLTRPPQANDLFIAQTAAFLEASYPVHPLVDLSLAGMTSFDRPITVVIPSIRFSVSENLDAMLLSQLYKGRILNNATATPNIVYGRLRFSF